MLKGTLRIIFIAALAITLASPALAVQKKDPKKQRGGSSGPATRAQQLDAKAAALLNQEEGEFQTLNQEIGQVKFGFEAGDDGYDPGLFIRAQLAFDQTIAGALQQEESATQDLVSAWNAQVGFDNNLTNNEGTGIIGSLWAKSDELAFKVQQTQQIAGDDSESISQLHSQVNTLQANLDQAINSVVAQDSHLHDETGRQLASEENQIEKNTGLIDDNSRQLVTQNYQVLANEKNIKDNTMRESVDASGIDRAYWRAVNEQAEINHLSEREATQVFQQALTDDRLSHEIHANQTGIMGDFKIALHDAVTANREQHEINGLSRQAVEEAAEIALNKAAEQNNTKTMEKDQVLANLREQMNQMGIDKIDAHIQSVEDATQAAIHQAELISDDNGLGKTLTKKLKTAFEKIKTSHRKFKAGDKSFAKDLLEARVLLAEVSSQLKKVNGLSPKQLQKLKFADDTAKLLTKEVENLGIAGGHDARDAAEITSFADSAMQSQKRNLDYFNAHHAD